MSENSNLEIITPLDILISKEVRMAVLPGLEGDLGVMKKHTPLMTLLKRGVIKLYDSNNKITEQVVIDGGVAEVKSEKILVLVERAELASPENKQIVNEKIINSKKQINNLDPSISSLATEETNFLSYVLGKIN